MGEWAQFGAPYAFMALGVSLVITLLRMRRDEIQDMQRRMHRVERENLRCSIVQGRLVTVLFSNGLSVPEGTFIVRLEGDDDDDAQGATAA